MKMLFDSLPLTHQRLFSLLQSGLWGTNVDGNLFDGVSLDEWEELANLSAVQGVFAIVFDSLNKLSVAQRPSKNLMIEWALGVKRIEHRYFRQRESLKKLSTLFYENQIKCLLLKGIGIGKHYLNPAHRESGDLDIYLFGEFDKGNRLIEEKGIRVDYTSEVHSVFRFSEIPVENHLSFLAKNRSKMDLELELALHQLLSEKELQYEEELGVYLPSLEFNFLFLFRHAVKHFLGSGLVLRYLCDWALILEKCNDTSVYKQFYDRISSYHLQGYADVFNAIAVQYLGVQKKGVFSISHDSVFIQKVFLDIMNQKRAKQVVSSRNPQQIIGRKLSSAASLFVHRWKYDFIDRKTFRREFFLRIRSNFYPVKRNCRSL